VISQPCELTAVPMPASGDGIGVGELADVATCGAGATVAVGAAAATWLGGVVGVVPAMLRVAVGATAPLDSRAVAVGPALVVLPHALSSIAASAISATSAQCRAARFARSLVVCLIGVMPALLPAAFLTTKRHDIGKTASAFTHRPQT
jgi:hypothetical protein